MSCQHEVQRLRDRELQLQADLGTASREINRLRDGFVTSVMAAKARDRDSREDGGAAGSGWNLQSLWVVFQELLIEKTRPRPGIFRWFV